MASEDSMLNLRGLTPNHADPNLGPSGPGFDVFSSVLKYCSLILILPIVSFFVTKSLLLETVMGITESPIYVNVVSAAVAVIILHIGLGIFIYKAYFETETPKARLGKQE